MTLAASHRSARAAPRRADEAPPGADPSIARPERLDALTGLRAFAATAVVLFHFSDGMFHGLDLPRYIPFVDRYYLGVDLFFILSGFILAHVHGQDFARLTPRNMTRFYILRLARIYPVHAAVLMMYLGLFLLQRQLGPQLGVGLRADPGHYTASAFVTQLLLINPGTLTWNFPAWSVSAEWSAYLWFPMLALALRRASVRWCLVGLAAIIAGFGVVYLRRFDGSMDQLGLVRVSFEFPAGYLIYRASFRAPLRRLLPTLALVAALALFALPTRLSDFACVLVIGALVALVGHRPSERGRWYTSRFLLWLGEISYSLYMIQALVIATVGRAAERLLLPHLSLPLQLALVPALLIVTILCAGVLHRAVEKPARDWMRAWLIRTARSARDRFRVIGTYEPSR